MKEYRSSITGFATVRWPEWQAFVPCPTAYTTHGKYLWNPIESNRYLIVLPFSSTDLVKSIEEYGKYNPILVWLNRISKIFLCVKYLVARIAGICSLSGSL